MVTMNCVHTARLRLEPLEARHASALFDGLCDERLYQWDDGTPPSSMEWLRNRYEVLSSRRAPDKSQIWLNWALWLVESARYIGFVQATLQQKQAFVAYVLFSDVWGLGLGREAVRAMIEEITRSYGICEFYATADEANSRSTRLLDALGFERVTTAQEARSVVPGTDVTYHFRSANG
jgi:RimJ/RimL family protein N-acetyltransferase